MDKYAITIIDFSKPLTADNYMDGAITIYKDTFAAVCDYIGARPCRQRAGWTASKGNKEYIITRV